MNDLERVNQFRNRLVAHMNVVLPHADGFRWGGVDANVAARIGSEQTWLAQEYGRLYDLINQYGSMMMLSPALGVTSRDVIQDAIHDVGDVYYRDIARISVQHLDTVIGRMTADEERAEREREAAERKKAEEDQRRADELDRKARARADDPDRWYRLTSPVYWTRRLGTLVKWLFTTTRGRIAGVLSLLFVAIISGIVSGVAQGWYQQVMGGR